MFCIKRYRLIEINEPDESKTAQLNSDKKLFDRAESPRKLCILIFAVWLSTYCVMESTIMNFGATYLQYSPLRLTARKAAEMVSIINLCFTIGRGLSIFISMRVRPQYMIAYHFAILYLSTIALIIWGQYSLPVLWVTNVCIGLGLSALFPAMFAYLEQYIVITNPIGTCVILASDVFNLFNPYVLGLMVERHSVVVIIFQCMYLVLCSTLFVGIIVIVNKYQRISKKFNSLHNNNNVFVLT